jgi:hypothetical protein
MWYEVTNQKPISSLPLRSLRSLRLNKKIYKEQSKIQWLNYKD